MTSVPPASVATNTSPCFAALEYRLKRNLLRDSLRAGRFFTFIVFSCHFLGRPRVVLRRPQDLVGDDSQVSPPLADPLSPVSISINLLSRKHPSALMTKRSPIRSWRPFAQRLPASKRWMNVRALPTDTTGRGIWGSRDGVNQNHGERFVDIGDVFEDDGAGLRGRSGGRLVPMPGR